MIGDRLGDTNSELGERGEVGRGGWSERRRGSIDRQRKTEEGTEIVAITRKKNTGIEERDDALEESGIVRIIANMGEDCPAQDDARAGGTTTGVLAGEKIEPVLTRLEGFGAMFEIGNGGQVDRGSRPANAPEAFADRATLWNAVEAAEKRLDAQVAREVQLSLPHELDADQRRELVRDYVQREFVDKGMIADVAIHAPDEDGDQRNHHAHVMLTTRRVDETGFGAKERAWNARPQLAEWREQWAETQNRHLAKALGPNAPQVTHKSLEDQGIERAATIHLGPTASAIERKGERSDRGEVNRQIAVENVERRDIRKEITATYDRHAEVSPQTQSSTASLKTELANYQAQMQRQAAEWKAAKVAIVVPETIKIATVRREIVGPARDRRVGRPPTLPTARLCRDAPRRPPAQCGR